MLKKVFAYLLSWALFWMGDGVSKIMHLIDNFGHLYPIYNKSMNWSYDIQNWANNKTPWSPYIQPNNFRCQYWKNDV